MDKKLQRRSGEVTAGAADLCASARTVRARDIVVAGHVGGDQAPAAFVGALHHCRKHDGVLRRALALLAPVPGKLADAAPASHMTDLALHGKLA